MKIGVFIPIGNNGWLISTHAPQYKPTFELNKAIVQKAEREGRRCLIIGTPEHPEVRVVAHAKNSLGQPGESQRYRICPQGTVAYDGPCTLTADAIIREAGTPATGNGRPSAALANAIEALEKQLSFVGWVEAGEVYRLCAERDISVSTIRRARVALGLKTLYIGNQPNRKNYWYQPELEEASVVADITNQNQQIQLA